VLQPPLEMAGERVAIHRHCLERIQRSLIFLTVSQPPMLAMLSVRSWALNLVNALQRRCPEDPVAIDLFQYRNCRQPIEWLFGGVVCRARHNFTELMAFDIWRAVMEPSTGASSDHAHWPFKPYKRLQTLWTVQHCWRKQLNKCQVVFVVLTDCSLIQYGTHFC